MRRKERDGQTPATATVLMGDMVVILLFVVVIVGEVGREKYFEKTEQ